MTTHRQQPEKEIIFFITITCYNWIPLFEIINFYDAVYKWFDVMKELNNQVSGYVIMPTHLHALVRVSENSPGINKLVANGKRFMAYEIVKRLKQLNKNDLLHQLKKAVSPDEMQKGKLHSVFVPPQEG